MMSTLYIFFVDPRAWLIARAAVGAGSEVLSM
jgi:hypothetical protein